MFDYSIKGIEQVSLSNTNYYKQMKLSFATQYCNI